MTLYLFDSDALIDYLRNRRGAVSLVNEIGDREDILCTCDVVVAEVLSGVHSEGRANATGFLRSLRRLTTTFDAAVAAGIWREDYARRGFQLATTDVLIAATALSYGATVVTANLKDYPMPELSLLPLPR